jgi:hypothetical protein
MVPLRARDGAAGSRDANRTGGAYCAQKITQKVKVIALVCDFVVLMMQMSV